MGLTRIIKRLKKRREEEAKKRRRKSFLEPLEQRLLLDAITAHWTGGSGDWSDPSNWDIGEVPNDGGGNTYTAIIDLAKLDPTIQVTRDIRVSGLKTSETVRVKEGGSLTSSGTVVNKGDLAATGGTLRFSNATVANAGSTLTADGGTLVLESSTISGGTIQAMGVGGPVSVLSSSTLDGVILNADTTVSDSSLRVKNGLELNGTVTLASSVEWTALYFDGTQTLSGTGQVVFGGTHGSYPQDRIYAVGDPSGNNPATLTIGPGITIHGSQNGMIGGYYTNDALINQGTIDADTAGKTIRVSVANLTNTGLLKAENGGTLSIEGNWTNTGSLSVSDGTLNLGGSFTTTGLGTLDRTGGSVNITGTLDNSGTILALTSATGSLQLAGTIKNGTVAATGGAQLLPTGGTLDGVTLNADTTISDTSLRVKNGLELNGTITLASSGEWAALYFDGSQTISGTGQVVFGGTHGSYPQDRIYAVGDPSGNNPATLTIGPGITIHGNQNGIITRYYTNDSIVNQGIIDADTPGKTITVSLANLTNTGLLRAENGGTLSIAGNWTNTGLLSVSDGILNLGGNFTTTGLGTLDRTGGTVNITGTLDNSGTILALTSATGSLQLAGTIKNGTVTATGGAELLPTGGTLEGVILNAGTTIGDTSLRVKNGLELNGTLTLASSGEWAALYFDGTQTLSGTGQVVFGGTYGGYPQDRIYAVGDPWGNNPATLTIGPSITIHGSQNGIIDRYYTNDSIINQGTIDADTAGKTITVNWVNSQGILEAVKGATIDVNGSVAIDGLNRLFSQPFGTISVAGDLLGATRNTDKYSPQGTTRLDGSGMEASPQLLEAMSQDWGTDSAGFARNFAYGTLVLANNTYLKLVDLSDNATGPDAEAVYTDSLIVPDGTTLDLNGFHLYTRAPQIAGTVVGGKITQIPDSGPISVGSPTPGAIALAGELDEWTFFARAGQSVTVVVDTGSTSILTPELGWVAVKLVDSANTVLAAAASTASSQVVTLDDTAVPADGTYRVCVKAPDDHPLATGNYQVTVWDVTADISELVLNRQYLGTIETPYSVDRWVLSATQYQQIRFDLISRSDSTIVFDLAGPEGFTGFSNVSVGSNPITLPSSGTYILTAHGSGGQYGGSYSFRLEQTQVTDLALGTTHTGQFAGSSQAELFRLDVLADNPLLVVLEDAAANNVNELYLKFGAPPTRGDYDYRFSNPAAADQEVLAPMAYPGTWYVLVYGNTISTPSTYELTASMNDVFLTSVTPDHHGNCADAVLTIHGAGFSVSTQVALIDSDDTVYVPSSVAADSFTQLTATVAAGSVPAGVYTIRVTVPSGTCAELPNAFEMIAGGEAHLDAEVIVPSAIGYHLPATIYVEYGNTGTIAMPAPLLTLTALLNGLQGAFLTLDQTRAGESFWSEAVPVGYTTSVSFMADGVNPGMLQPGESVTIPVHYAGWISSQWDFSRPVIHFNLNSYTADDSRPIDWTEFGEQIRPAGIDDTTWAPVLDRLKEQIGTTWGDYISTLAQDASRLARLGESTNDASDLLEFELDRANGVPVGVISGRIVDAASGQPLAGLTINDLSNDLRSFASSTTDAAGSFTLTGLYDGVHNLTLSGYLLDSDASVTITAKTDAINLEFSAREAGHITGHVTSALVGQKLANVRVLCIGQTTGQVFQVLTGADGTYQLETLPSDTYELTYSGDGFVSDTIDGIDVELGQTRPNVNANLTFGAFIGGTVRCGIDSSALPGATVLLNHQDTDGNGLLMRVASTDDAGTYLFGDLPSGTYTVEVVAPGHVGASSVPTPVNEGGNISDLDFALQNGAILSGSVISQASSTVIPGAVVRVQSDAGAVFRASSDETGQFAFDTLPAGTYSVTITLTGYVPWRADVVVTTTTPASLSAVLSPGAIVSGSVRSSDGQLPVESALVELFSITGERAGSAISNYTGEYLLPAVHPGTYTTAVVSSSYTFAPIDVEVTSTSPISLTLVATGALGSRLEGDLSPMMLDALSIDRSELALQALRSSGSVQSTEADLVKRVSTWDGKPTLPLPVGDREPLPPGPSDYAPAELQSLWLRLYEAYRNLGPESTLDSEQRTLDASLRRIGGQKELLNNSVHDFAIGLIGFVESLFARLGEATAGTIGVQISFYDYVTSSNPTELLKTAMYDVMQSVRGLITEALGKPGGYILDIAEFAGWVVDAGITWNQMIEVLEKQKQTIISNAQSLENAEINYDSDRCQYLKAFGKANGAYLVLLNKYRSAYAQWLREASPQVDDTYSDQIPSDGLTSVRYTVLQSHWKPDAAHLEMISYDPTSRPYGSRVSRSGDGLGLMYEAFTSSKLAELAAGSVAHDVVYYRIEDTITHLQATGRWIIPVVGTNNNGEWNGDDGPPSDPKTQPVPNPNPTVPPDPDSSGGGGDSQVVYSSDPNDKIGPAGYSNSAYVVPTSLLAYRINFENEASATAPAQQVVITDQVDSDLDWNTFALTEIGFGDRLIAVPGDAQHFETVVPMSYNGVDFEVWIEAGIDLATGQVYAVFQSIDPITSLPPNVLTGFLPPEDGTGRGMGHISYLINPKADLFTGTEIRNIALISFDGQPQIATNQVDPHDPSQGTDPTKEALDTIDAGTPTSNVLPLPPTVNQADFLVEWTGVDDAGGSGIASYDIFVSADGAAYALWKDDIIETSATFTGEPGHSYAFYSIAKDNVGHVEAAPAAPDATISLVPSNTAPLARDDTYTLDEDTDLTVPARGVLNNDIDEESDLLTATLVAPPAHGTLALNTNGSFTYSPADNFNGTDSFTYMANDGQVVSNVATVNLNITPVNDTPVADIVGEARTVDEGYLFTLIGTISDPDDPTEELVYTWDFGDGATTTGTLTPNHTYADNGLYTVTLSVADAAGAVGTDTLAVTVTNVAPSVDVGLAEEMVQYSDPITTVTVTATDVPADTLSIATQWLKVDGSFTNGLPDAGTIAGGLTLGGAGGAGSGTWTLSGLADLAPGTYTIRFTVTDEDGGRTSQDTTLQVTKENALADYTGALFASTSSVTSSKATVTLSTTIRDITASADLAYDAYPGDIRMATVSFINRDNNTVIGSAPVGLVNIGDTKTGTATYNWDVNIGNADCVQYTVGVIVDGCYTRNSSWDDTVVTVSKPYTTGFITGGGYLTLTNSAGQKSGDVGSKDNFGFNVKFNKSGTNLQGKINTIIRRTESDGIVHVYQIKGNSMTSLSVPATPGNTATFNGKASIQDITNPLAPISVDGNAILQVTMTDNGEPGSADTIGITIWNKSGGLWFASNWNGTKTIGQKLAGGNLKVYKALQAADGESLQSAGVQNALTQEMLQPIVTEAFDLWQQASVDPKLLLTTSEAVVQIADLPGADLAQASAAGVILIDSDAAGHGWFVDKTPADDREFKIDKGNGELLATKSSDAYGHMDLLTVVMHELGHVLGLDDVDPKAQDLMSATLDVGTRRLNADTAETPKMVQMERLPGSELEFALWGVKDNTMSWLEDFLVGIAGRNHNPFDPKGNTKIKISLFSDDDEEK